jgi:RNA polymerase sigma factor (sigma-70 family)
MEITGAEASEQIYLSYRPLMFSLAYRMLGSVMDAEDVVQEAFLYANETNLEHVHNPKAYLCKIVTNRCIDSLRSASKKREVYVGPWLPEPLMTTSATSADHQIAPDLAYTHKESLSTAYLLLLQQLTWMERAVFLLREVLQYEYDEIAEIVGKSSTNCRQIFCRAKNAISLPTEQAECNETNDSDRGTIRTRISVREYRSTVNHREIRCHSILRWRRQGECSDQPYSCGAERIAKFLVWRFSQIT